MKTIKIIPPKRGWDRQGSGEYGAARAQGTRRHNGIDIACYPGSQVLAITAGKVTKLGFPYKHDLSFRYVQVTDVFNNNERYFYVNPAVEVGDYVQEGDVLGVTQELPYEGITQHYHLEIKDGNNDYLNPNEWLAQ